MEAEKIVLLITLSVVAGLILSQAIYDFTNPRVINYTFYEPNLSIYQKINWSNLTWETRK